MDQLARMTSRQDHQAVIRQKDLRRNHLAVESIFSLMREAK
jgi:hypothetical protein